MFKLFEQIKEYIRLSRDVRIKRKNKNKAERAITETKDVVEWGQKATACICFYRNINMPMSARAFMRVPLEKDCDDYNKNAVCVVGEAKNCPFFPANKQCFVARQEYTVSCDNRKEFVKSVFGLGR